MKRVWVIYSRNKPSEPFDTDKATFLSDEGFFIHSGDAQHHCNTMNRPALDGYERYHERYRMSQNEMTEDYTIKKRAYDILVAAGEEPFFAEPEEPSMLPMLTFNQWWDGRDYIMTTPVALNINE